MIPAPQTYPTALGEGLSGPSLLQPIRHNIDQPPSNQPLDGPTGSQVVVDPIALQDPIQMTSYPYVTGTSVIGIKYKDGVMIGSDMLASYGSTKRYKDFTRIYKVNARVVIAASGELSDFQYIVSLLQSVVRSDMQAADGVEATPTEVFSYLQNVLYNRRNRMNPLWNTLVVGGIENDGSPVLGTIGMIGLAYQDSHVTTGFSNHLARPLFRNRQSDDMEEGAAEALMKDALKACNYRDARSINKYQLAKVTKDGVEISAPFAVDMNWNYKQFENPTRIAPGAW